MPRRTASASVPADQETQQAQQDQAPRAPNNDAFVSRFLGEASSMDRHNKGTAQNGDDNRNGNGDVNGDTNGDVEMIGASQHDADTQAVVHRGPSSTPTGARAPKRKHADMDEVPYISMHELRLRQLKEDQEAYTYDLQWCQDVLATSDDLSPAETRSFNLRQLDLGHQVRAVNHSISQLECEMQNFRLFGTPGTPFGRSGLSSALFPQTSFMWDGDAPQERRGPGRPPGSKNRPKDMMSTPQPAAPSSNAQKAAALASAGAKRILPTEIRVATRKSLDALPCESCKHLHLMFEPGLEAPVDMTCAMGHNFILTTPRLANGGPAGTGPAMGDATDRPSKRAHVQASSPINNTTVQVGSPIDSTIEDDNDANVTANPTTPAVGAAGHAAEVTGDNNATGDVVRAITASATASASGRRGARARETAKNDDQNGSAATGSSKKKNNASNSTNINASSAGGVATPSAAANTLPTRTTPSTSKKAAPAPPADIPAVTDDTPAPGTPAGTPAASSSAPGGGLTPAAGLDPTGPGGARYQRLGHHMCQLCTSQKYLMQTTPKQPSEPSSWPLRDVSKMVTHYTRMHTEHNKMERCMELGRALEDNKGPFRYWLQETKRVKVTPEGVSDALAALAQGRLPDMLRQLSNAAKAFPKD